MRTDLQWNIFSANPREVTNEAREAETLLQACTGWTGQDYRGRLVLDVGTGAGSFAEVVATFGGEVVGVDFNAAVDVAYHRLRRFKNVHLVQADLSALPFCEETFDLAYSMGVLHHTPDPATAFVRIAGAVKSSGGLALLLHNQERLAGKVGNLIRRVTTRLPLGAALALTAVSIPFYCACRLPVLGAGLEAIYPIRMRRHWRGRWLETFEWCTATYQWPLPSAEVERWFRTNGFHNVELLGNPVRVRSWKEPAAANNVQSVLRPPLVARG